MVAGMAHERAGRAMVPDGDVEVAARAIQEVCGNRSGRGKPFDQLPQQLQDDYRAEARAALEAVQSSKA